MLILYQITSRFLQKESFRNSGHKGIDFSMPNGTPLRSIQDGYIERIVDYGSANVGKGIFVRWEDGKTAIYGHLSKFNPNLKIGDKVQTGEIIGYSGNSGHVVGKNGGYHLHFGLKENGKFLDPSPYIEQIQNMNNPEYLKHITEYIAHKPEAIQKTVSFFDALKGQLDMYNGIGEYLSVNFIHIFHSFGDLVNNSILMQYIQYIFQFFS